MDELINTLNNTSLKNEESTLLIAYIKKLNIDENIKDYLCYLIDNDNLCDYQTIYNICIENDIELPPF
jgi:hypothetical protein